MAKQQAKQPEAAKKPSYEELIKIIGDMDRRLHDKQKMEQVQEVSARLTFLFKVVENADKFPAEYVADITKEITEILPAGKPEEQEQSQGNEQ